MSCQLVFIFPHKSFSSFVLWYWYFFIYFGYGHYFGPGSSNSFVKSCDSNSFIWEQMSISFCCSSRNLLAECYNSFASCSIAVPVNSQGISNTCHLHLNLHAIAHSYLPAFPPVFSATFLTVSSSPLWAPTVFLFPFFSIRFMIWTASA